MFIGWACAFGVHDYRRCLARGTHLPHRRPEKGPAREFSARLSARGFRAKFRRLEAACGATSPQSNQARSVGPP